MSFIVDKFREIDGRVRDRSIEAMSIGELSKLKASLLANTPTPEVNPIIHNHWSIAYQEISTQIDSKVAKRRFRIGLGMSTIILLISLVNLIRDIL